ncbi:MAG: hypothetical protein IT436_13580 [Phycisphaerales bacterium]|nr:hypothetical protein [Phycisphaerales bacterium]
MGHQRLGRLPNSKPWLEVVALLADGAPCATVADAVMEAAEDGMQLARTDRGVSEAVWLLVQMAIAAKGDDFTDGLRSRGIPIVGDPDPFVVAAAIHVAMDRHFNTTRERSDLGEMAHLAAVQAVLTLSSDGCSGLFRPNSREVHKAFRSLAKEKGFSTLIHVFFSRWTQKFLTYHLGRELSNHVGVNQRFGDPAAHDGFVGELGVQCGQAALIVKQFAGEWFGKNLHKTGITREQATGFTVHAMDKIRAELRVRGGRS